MTITVEVWSGHRAGVVNPAMMESSLVLLQHLAEQTDRQTNRQDGRQTDRQTDRQADRQTDRQMDGMADRQRTPIVLGWRR